MLNYIRFSTRKGENKTLIEIRTAKDCRLDAVIESVSYPFFECAYSLTAEHGEEWLLRIADLHMENWKEVYMPSDAMPDEDDENWEVAYCEQGEKEKKSVGRGVYPDNWKEFLKIMDEIVPFPDRLIKSLWNIREMSGSRRKMKRELKMRLSTGIIKKK